MYKMLVVDDEFNIRDGIANAVAWDTIDVKVVGTAMDGSEALQTAKEKRPDIIITDVCMYDMDGLELTSVIREIMPETKIIILSGYDEFEYVQKALELKVHSYIMKPANSRELIQTVKKVIGEIEKDRKLEDKINSMRFEIDKSKLLLTERFLYNLVHGNIASKADFDSQSSFLDISFRKKYYTCVTVTLPRRAEVSTAGEIQSLQDLIFKINEIFISFLNEFEAKSIFYGQDNLIIIAGFQDEKEYTVSLNHKLEAVVEAVVRILKKNIIVSVGGLYPNPMDLSKSFRESSLAFEHNIISEDSMIVNINDITSTYGAKCIYPLDKENLLLKNLSEANSEKTNAIITSLFSDIQQQNYTHNQIKIDIMGLLSGFSRKAMDMGVDIYSICGEQLAGFYSSLNKYISIKNIEKQFINIAAETIKEIQNQQIDTTKSVIIKANQYLEENYSNTDLSLVTLSNYLHLNHTYFSRLYKKETGKNYVDVLTRIRIEKAKDMLKNTNEKISEISVKVGYLDSKYFCTLFKKITGVTPIEYREI